MKKTYALIARGNSMSRAQIRGKTIEDSDYVLVERSDSYSPVDGDYVVSIIDNMANIKKFKRDWVHERVILSPESHDAAYLPIIIAGKDMQYFHIAGRVIDVIKGTSHLY